MNSIASSLVNGILSVEPLAKFAKNRARNLIVKRAETLGVRWRDEVKALQHRSLETADSSQSDEIHPLWEKELASITNPDTRYPSYYTNASFHAYEESNLGWRPAMEVEVASRAVHARIWPEGDERAGLPGDESLRSSYHQVLNTLPTEPKQIVDLGCGGGLSSFTLQQTFPAADITGVDLSPYFLTVAQYQATHRPSPAGTKDIRWIHASAEETGLPSESADLVSACLVFHELPSTAARQIIAEAYRVVRPGGHFAIMDMDPGCQTFARMPPYVFTILRSTEPFLDQYLSLDFAEAFTASGFSEPRVVHNSPRHRTIVAQKPKG